MRVNDDAMPHARIKAYHQYRPISNIGAFLDLSSPASIKSGIEAMIDESAFMLSGRVLVALGEHVSWMTKVAADFKREVMVVYVTVDDRVGIPRQDLQKICDASKSKIDVVQLCNYKSKVYSRLTEIRNGKIFAENTWRLAAEDEAEQFSGFFIDDWCTPAQEEQRNVFGSEQRRERSKSVHRLNPRDRAYLKGAGRR